MVMMPLALACVSIAAPDAGSRSTIMSTLTPLFIIDCAIVFILAGAVVRRSGCRRSGCRSCTRLQRDRVRGDPARSTTCRVRQDDADLRALAIDRAAARADRARRGGCGRRSRAAGRGGCRCAEELPPLPPLELQAASANAAATPIAATGTLLLRMQNAFPLCGRPRCLAELARPNVVGANISDGPRHNYPRHQLVPTSNVVT